MPENNTSGARTYLCTEGDAYNLFLKMQGLEAENEALRKDAIALHKNRKRTDLIAYVDVLRNEIRDLRKENERLSDICYKFMLAIGRK